MIDTSLLELFLQEVQTYTALIGAELASDRAYQMEVLIRAVHSIRGAARIVQLEDIARLAGALENYLEDVRQEGLSLATVEPSFNFLTSLGTLTCDQLLSIVPSLGPIVAIHLGVIAQRPGTEVLDIELVAPHLTLPSDSTPPPFPIDTSFPDLSDFSMLELFRLEVENQVGILNQGLLALENDVTDIEQIDTLMRAAHSIKGAARIVQIEAAVQLSHGMEDCLIAVREEKLVLQSQGIDVLFRAADLLAEMGKRLTPEDSQALHSLKPELDRLIQALHDITQGKGTPAPTAVAPVEPAPPVHSPPKAEDLRESQGNERVVRVSKENLNRLMGLAGESLVSANWLQPFADSLLKLKKTQSELSRLLERGNSLYTHRQVLNEYELSFIRASMQKADLCRQILSDRLNELEVFARQSANLSDRLYREVIASHMRPFADGVHGFPRMVRDVAKKLGKQVKLEITGKSTQVDRDILEKLEAPLTHILRNAIDHGLESPEERLAQGKSPIGILRLEALHRAGMLCITITDDGRGIHFGHLRQKIIHKGLATAAMAEQMSDAELIDFLFLPGFSTTTQVTEISGRGVGLDIVQSMVQEVGGMVRASSQEGKGTTFHLQLPLTLSVIRTLLVTIGGEPYAFPLSRIDCITFVPQSEIHTLENRAYFTFNQHQVGIIAAAQVLELPFQPLAAQEIAIVLISDRSNRYGLVVDQFLGEKELVVRPLDPRLGKVPNISAAALMEDGSTTLIVDVEDLVRSIDKLLNSDGLNPISYEHQAEIAPKRILVVDDSLTVREVERKLLENQGYEVAVSVNGMDGWNALRMDGKFDLVITDVDMPRMNGLELVTHMRNHPTFKSMPVIIVSYKDRPEDRLRGMEVGADFYLTKSSFHDNSLLQAVQDLLGSH